MSAELFTRSFELDRSALVRYAGASGDFNPIHYNERVALEVGLPGVIAHGMLTMGLAGSALSDWLDDPAALKSYSVRFTRPIVIPDPGVVDLEVTASLGSTDGALSRIDLKVSVAGQAVLGKAHAWVQSTALGSFVSSAH